MLKLVKFDGTKTYMFPNGDLATPEVFLDNYTAINVFPHVLEISGDVCQAVMSLNSLRQMHNIDDSLSEGEAIAELEYIINNPPVFESEITAEERIASALEFQNLLNI